MDMEKISKMLFDSLESGVAVAEPEGHEILSANRRFSEWFPGVSGIGCSLDDVFTDISMETVQSCIDDNRPFKTEVEIKIKRRAVCLALQITASTQKETPVLIVECQNISKVKELEYMIQSYTQMVEKQNRQLRNEKERVEKLLLNVMPKTIYEELKEFGVTSPTKYENASVLMLDFVGFTDMAISRDPANLITELNDIFTAFDRIAEQFGCERIKTMGDAYMAVSGIPEATPDHAHNIARLALLMVRYLHRRNATHDRQWHCRVGINSGAVIGSIVGVQKYVYDIFGPGVNLAARMETFSGDMEISLCEDMLPYIENDFAVAERGEHKVKGFGQKKIYELTGMHHASNAGFQLAS
ncbi:MAG: adenylate/guanylate cyclase domain-containing protein [Stappiaceae bacterium]